MVYIYYFKSDENHYNSCIEQKIGTRNLIRRGQCRSVFKKQYIYPTVIMRWCTQPPYVSAGKPPISHACGHAPCRITQNPTHHVKLPTRHQAALRYPEVPLTDSGLACVACCDWMIPQRGPSAHYLQNGPHLFHIIV